MSEPVMPESEPEPTVAPPTSPPRGASQATREDPPESVEIEDRRRGKHDRRVAAQDRRDPERLADDIAPRRHPNSPGRRSSDR